MKYKFLIKKYYIYIIIFIMFSIIIWILYYSNSNQKDKNTIDYARRVIPDSHIKNNIPKESFEDYANRKLNEANTNNKYIYSFKEFTDIKKIVENKDIKKDDKIQQRHVILKNWYIIISWEDFFKKYHMWLIDDYIVFENTNKKDYNVEQNNLQYTDAYIKKIKVENLKDHIKDETYNSIIANEPWIDINHARLITIYWTENNKKIITDTQLYKEWYIVNKDNKIQKLKDTSINELSIDNDYLFNNTLKKREYHDFMKWIFTKQILKSNISTFKSNTDQWKFIQVNALKNISNIAIYNTKNKLLINIYLKDLKLHQFKINKNLLKILFWLDTNNTQIVLQTFKVKLDQEAFDKNPLMMQDKKYIDKKYILNIK